MADIEEINELKRLIHQAVQNAYQEEASIAGKKGMEQAIVFRVAVQLQELLKGSMFSALNLDCEYNKNLGKTKKTAHYPDGIRPDLIIHKRNTHDHNKLVVEFKGWWNKDHEDDIQKLKDLTALDDDYKYTLGVFVNLSKGEPQYLYFQYGNEE